MSMHYKCNEGEVDYHVTDSSEAEGDTHSAPHQQEQPAAEAAQPATSEPEPARAASPPKQKPTDQEAGKPKRYLPLCTRVQRNRIAGRNQFSRRKVDLWQMQRAYRSLEREAKEKKQAENAKRDGEEKEKKE